MWMDRQRGKKWSEVGAGVLAKNACIRPYQPRLHPLDGVDEMDKVAEVEQSAGGVLWRNGCS